MTYTVPQSGYYEVKTSKNPKFSLLVLLGKLGIKSVPDYAVSEIIYKRAGDTITFY